MGFSWFRQMRRKNGFKIGEWSIEPSLDRISNAGRVVNLQPQVMEVLVYLADHAGEVISSDELTANVWQDRVVTSSSIYVTLNQLRLAFGDDARNPRFIQTVPKKGYCLIAPVEGLDQEGNSPASIQTQTVPGNRNLMWGLSVLMIAVLGVGALLLLQETDTPSQVSSDNPASATQHSVAVLPFSDMSAGQDQKWFADGISEEIINRLAQIPGLKVTGRTSSFALRDTTADMQHIGQTLGVSYLLEGSVRTSEDQVRVTAQLLRADDGFHVWSENFQGSSHEVFEIQDEIATNIARTVLPNLVVDSDEHGTEFIQPAYTSYSAYELYLKGLEQIRLNTRQSLITAQDLLNRSLVIDPDFVDAHVSIAIVYERLRFVGYYEEFPAESFVKAATPHVERALEIEPDNAAANAVLGDILIRQGEKQIEAYNRALELNPNLQHVHTQLGILKLEERVSWRETLPHLQRAAEIEPLDVEAALTLILFMQNVPQRWDEAEEMLARLDKSHPDRADVKERQAEWQLWVKGRPSEAIPLFEQTLILDPDRTWSKIFLARSWNMVGEFEKARQLHGRGQVLGWAAVFDPDREAVLQKVKAITNWGEIADYGRRLSLAHALVMLRDYQTAVDMLAMDTKDMDRFIQVFTQQFGWHNDPGMSLAVAHWALGNHDEYEKWSEFARDSINIRTENGRLRNYRYSRAIARLNAMEGRHYDAALELEWFIRNGPLDIRELLYPAYDGMRGTSRFSELKALQLERVNTERLALDLDPLPDWATLTNHVRQPDS